MHKGKLVALTQSNNPNGVVVPEEDTFLDCKDSEKHFDFFKIKTIFLVKYQQ